MKRLKILSLIVACSLALSISAFGIHVFGTSSSINTPYEYPIQPGTEEWIALGSFVNRVQACRIPDEVLDRMSTQALVETFLHFPFLSNMMIYNSMSIGFQNVRCQSDALGELLMREDGAQALCDTYISLTDGMDRQSYCDATAEKGMVLMYPHFLEVALAQPEVFDSLDDETQALLIEAVNSYNNNRPSTFSMACNEHQ